MVTVPEHARFARPSKQPRAELARRVATVDEVYQVDIVQLSVNDRGKVTRMAQANTQSRKGRAPGKAKSKTRGRAKSAGGAPTTYKLVGDPVSAFVDVKLPKKATVFIVPGDAQAEKALQKIGPDRIRRLKGPGVFSPEGRFVRRGARQGSPAKPGPIDLSAYEPDARARAILRGRRTVEEDLKQSGGAYELDEVRELLHGISRQMVDRKVKDGSLLAVTGPSSRRVYPTVQFNKDGLLVAGLKAVREALPTENPWAVLNFLVRPDSRLDGRKPIDLLREGHVDVVVQAARGMGEQGA